VSSATRIWDRFKNLLDVSWGSIADGNVLKRSGSNIVGAVIEAGPPGLQGPPGVAQIWRGEYNPATTYQSNDAVGYQGNSFVATQVTTGVAPVPPASPVLPPLANTVDRGSIAALPPSNQVNYYARGDNTWQILPQTTYVVGPASSVSGDLANYADTTGKLLGGVTRTAAVPVGGVVQTKFLEIPSASVTTISATAGNVPQITQGTQVGSLSITPFYSTSFIRTTIKGGLRGSAVQWFFAAVFRTGVTSALCYNWLYQTVNGAQATVAAEKYDTPATTSAITYTVRIGLHSAATLTIDGYTGPMVLTLQEIRQ
jgi:hypothetical protein